MAGVTGLEPAASAVTGQRSNQLSYTPASARSAGVTHQANRVKLGARAWAADAKEVGVGDPAEETYCHPDTRHFIPQANLVNMVVCAGQNSFFAARVGKSTASENSFSLLRTGHDHA